MRGRGCSVSLARLLRCDLFPNCSLDNRSSEQIYIGRVSFCFTRPGARVMRDLIRRAAIGAMGCMPISHLATVLRCTPSSSASRCCDQPRVARRDLRSAGVMWRNELYCLSHPQSSIEQYTDDLMPTAYLQDRYRWAHAPNLSDTAGVPRQSQLVCEA